MSVVTGIDGGVEVDPVAPARRRAARLSVVAGAAFLGLAALSSLLPGGGGQGGGSPSSSYTNRPDGTAAWAELLSRFGHRVDRLRGDLDRGMLDPGATVVVLDAPGLTGQEAHDLGRFVRLGGHLVAGGVGSGDWLRSVIGNPPTLADDGPRTADITAEEDTVCLMLAAWEVRPILQENASLTFKMLMEMVRRQRAERPRVVD